MISFLGIPDYIWHPLAGNGYQFWSGIGSDFGEYTIAVGIFATLWASYRKHNCHVQGCPRLSWHPDPMHGHPVCRHHHPDSGSSSLRSS